MLAGQLRDEEHSHAERVRRLVHVPDHLRNQVHDVGAHHPLVMLRPIFPCDLACKGQLVKTALPDTDGERRDGRVRDLRHDGGDGAGINPTAEERPHAHIA